MGRLRRTWTASLALALVGLVLIATAGTTAALPSTSFAGLASGHALDATISLGGNAIEISAGMADVTLTAGPAVNSVGQGFLLPGGIGGDSRAETTYPGDPGPKSESATSGLPSPFDNIDILGSSNSESNLVDGELIGVADGDIAEIDLGLTIADGLLGDVVDLISDTLGTITGGEDPLGIGGILGPILDQISEATGIVDVLNIDIGQAEATVSTQGPRVVAECFTRPGQVDILRDPLTGAPFISVVVQTGSATAEADGTAGGAMGSASPGLVSLIVAGGDPIVVEVPAGTTIDTGDLGIPPDVARVIINGATATAGPNPDNPLQFDAQANSVRIQVLVGGATPDAAAIYLDLSIGACLAQAAVEPAQVTTSAPTTAAPTTLGPTTTAAPTTTLPGTPPAPDAPGGGGLPPGFLVIGLLFLAGSGALFTWGVLRRHRLPSG